MNKRPNVVLVITDDQGYGELGCNGNPYIKTPNIDRFSEEAVQFDDFHAAPLCAPTRGALLTGNRPLRNGVWATCWGRSILHADEVTLAELFRDSGYATGMFGKWHLGDNYPYRPQDRGFQHVVAHKGGGVGQTPDFWGNNYFDDTYFRNGEPSDYKGYCTDVWFQEASEFIREHKSEPFFAYLATNAPHAPFLVEDCYSGLYRDQPEIVEPNFYGMITNIDENFGRLYGMLAEEGILDDTILIFMTDNGSSGCGLQDDQEFVIKGYNAGMRGMKASYYDGGHRVPFMMRWKNGNFYGDRKVEEMCLHIDVVPTLAELCSLTVPEGLQWDGQSFAGILENQDEFKERMEFVQFHQGADAPDVWECAVMTPRWRLIRGIELYDIKEDPGQQRNVAADHPQIAERLRRAQLEWWNQTESCRKKDSPIYVGCPQENPVCLNAMDLDGDVAWSQVMVANAFTVTGSWCVDVRKKGHYKIEVCRWPKEAAMAISQQLCVKEREALAPYHSLREAAEFCPDRAYVRIKDQEYETQVRTNKESVELLAEICEEGIMRIEAGFINRDGKKQGAYYVYITYLEKDC